MKCTECDPRNRQCEKKSFSCPFVHLSDEKIRILVTGLWMMGIRTSYSDEGGKGHCKSYPWVELAFDQTNEMLRKTQNALRGYHLTRPDIEWKVESQLGGVLWLVPENKNLPLPDLQRSASELGWFLHNVRK